MSWFGSEVTIFGLSCISILVSPETCIPGAWPWRLRRRCRLYTLSTLVVLWNRAALLLLHNNVCCTCNHNDRTYHRMIASKRNDHLRGAYE